MTQDEAPQTPGNRQVIDDAQFKKMMRDSQPSFAERYFHCIVTLVIIAITVVVYIAEVVLSGFSMDISTMTLYSMGAMYAPAVTGPVDAWRFVAPMFLHVDLMHILFNMAALYSVGVLLEQVLGKGNFLALYFIAGVTGNITCYLVDMISGSYAVSAGASTSIFGLFMAAALLGVLSKRNRAMLRQYSKGMLSVIAINVVYSLAIPSVSLAGHLGGAIGGLLAMFMIPSRNLRVPVPVRIIVALIWFALVACVISGYWVNIALAVL